MCGTHSSQPNHAHSTNRPHLVLLQGLDRLLEVGDGIVLVEASLPQGAGGLVQGLEGWGRESGNGGDINIYLGGRGMEASYISGGAETSRSVDTYLVTPRWADFLLIVVLLVLIFVIIVLLLFIFLIVFVVRDLLLDPLDFSVRPMW